LIYPAESMRADGHEIDAFYYNPNIHPLAEYERRRAAALEYCGNENIHLVSGPYDIDDYFRVVVSPDIERCSLCYRVRLAAAARAAAAGGFDAFTTTLLVSPYQQHELLLGIGRQEAAKAGVEFYYQDWRPGFREGRAKARSLGLYSQKYCGCVYSEDESRARAQ
jgi:epoxyqueuosine reductase